MVMSGWERAFLLLLFPQILPYSSCESPNPQGPPYSSLASDSHHKLTPIFTTFLGIAGTDNRDFAFILYAWLGYCCFSPLPWFSPPSGIIPDFARNTGRQSAPEDDKWCRSRPAHSADFEKTRAEAGSCGGVLTELTNALQYLSFFFSLNTRFQIADRDGIKKEKSVTDQYV